MKKYILLALISLGVIASNAQPRQRRDTARTIWDSNPTSVSQTTAQLIHAPILRSADQEHRIIPRQQFCFDVMMEVELNFGSLSRLTAVFINTTDGYIGYTRPSRGGSINVLMPETEDFTFTVISYKMNNIYMYHNHKASRGEGIDHLVSTSNTEQQDYVEMNNITAAPLSRKTERRSYVYGTMNAQAYKRSDEPTIWYINTADYRTVLPPTLQVQKLIGAFGVGIIQTDFGPFILCERTNLSSYTKITNIERCHVCFDPSNYKLMEADFYAKGLESLRAETEKINRDEAAIQSHRHCQSEEMEVINFRRENVRVQEENLRRAQQGNLMQDRGAQKAFMGTANPLIVVKQSQLEAKVKICSIQSAMAEHPGDGSYQHKLDCAQQQLASLQTIEARMVQIDQQYTNVAEAAARKSQLLMQVYAQNCN
ncbi:MAG: hypothetical protein QM726_05960 [Chitinophagaceae bacterium]